MRQQAFKSSNISLNTTALSWVYILYNAISEEVNIGFSFNLAKQFSSMDKIEKLVYCRSFNDPFDALAHKYLMENLSIESIIHSVKQLNPSLTHLSHLL